MTVPLGVVFGKSKLYVYGLCIFIYHMKMSCSIVHPLCNFTYKRLDQGMVCLKVLTSWARRADGAPLHEPAAGTFLAHGHETLPSGRGTLPSQGQKKGGLAFFCRTWSQPRAKKQNTNRVPEGLPCMSSSRIYSLKFWKTSTVR